MDTDDIVVAQLANLGLQPILDQFPSFTLSKMECEEIYALCVEGLRLLYKRSGQAAIDKADGVKAGIALLPKKVPKSMSSRFAICESLTKELGNYGCDLAGDYNAIMYPTPEGGKAIIRWVVDALLKATEEEQQRAAKGSAEAKESEKSLSIVAASLVGLKATVEEHKVPTTTVRRRRVAPAFRFRTAPLSSVTDGERHDFQASVTTFKCNSSKQTKKGIASATFNSVLERNAIDALHGETVKKSLRAPLTSSTSVPITVDFKPSSKGAVNPSAATAEPQQRSTASLFFDTSEQGLDRDAFESRRTAEKEAQAAVDELQEKELSAKERGKQRVEEAQRVKDDLQAVKQEYTLRKTQIKALKLVRTELEAEFAAWQSEDAATASALAERQRILDEKSELLALLEDAEQNLIDLAASLEALTEQQTTARNDFLRKMNKVEAVREKLNEQLAEAGAGIEETLRELRAECKGLKGQCKEKHAELVELSEEYERCPKDIDRSKYLRYIFDMTNNLQRQQEEIDKVAKETAATESNIQTLTDDVKTIFEKLEGTVYDKATGKEAANTKDAFAKDAFRQIVDLRSSYLNLAQLIQDRGGLKKETHEAEEKSAKLQRLVASYNVEAVERDLAEVEKDIAKLEQLRAGAV